MKSVDSVDSLGKGHGFDFIVEGFLNNSSVSDCGLVERVVKEGHSVLAPFFVVTVREVVSSVSSSRFFSILGSEHGHLSLDHKVVKFKGLNQISVPDVTSVSNTNIFNFSRELVELIAALLKVVLATENGGVSLHSLLHTSPNLGCRRFTSAVADAVQVGNRGFTSILGEISLGLSGSELVLSGLSSGTSEND